MKYTKKQLLGRIFNWAEDYVVIENGKDVQIQSVKREELYPSYNLHFLNSECLDYLVPLPKINYEIY